jgi:chemotaxis protein MotB
MGKCKCPPAGAPEWVLTYGDLMSLLLCFFILLAALSEIKDDSVWKAKIEMVQQSFGLQGGGGKVPGEQVDRLSLIAKLERMYREQQKNKRTAETKDPGVQGRELRVTQSKSGIKRGLGSITFEPGSAELTDAAKARLNPIVGLIQGYNNKIELQGHASASEVNVVSAYPDLWQLSYARAQAVMNYLVNEKAIKPERIRLIANADKEPMTKREYEAPALELNRRVAIEISDQLAQE